MDKEKKSDSKYIFGILLTTKKRILPYSGKLIEPEYIMLNKPNSEKHILSYMWKLLKKKTEYRIEIPEC